MINSRKIRKTFKRVKRVIFGSKWNIKKLKKKLNYVSTRHEFVANSIWYRCEMIYVFFLMDFGFNF